MSGHCEHCDPERPGLCYQSKEFGIVHVSTESGEWHAHWVDGHCPMCAEAERLREANVRLIEQSIRGDS